MADNNARENKTKAGYSAHKSRGRPIPRVGSMHRLANLSRQTHPSHLVKRRALGRITKAVTMRGHYRSLNF